MQALEQDEIAGEKRLSELQAELESCGVSADILENAADALLIERDSLAADTQVEKDTSVFRLEGWVRSDEIDKVEQALKSVTEAYYTEYRDPAEDETPPTVLKNDKFNTPFESLITLYSLPDARGIDATPYMTPFYIFLFGVMLSDTGYGLVLALGSWLFLKLKKPKGGTADLAKVLFWGGISTMVSTRSCSPSMPTPTPLQTWPSPRTAPMRWARPSQASMWWGICGRTRRLS